MQQLRSGNKEYSFGILDFVYCDSLELEVPPREFAERLDPESFDIVANLTFKVNAEQHIRLVGSDKEDFRIALFDDKLLFFKREDIEC